MIFLRFTTETKQVNMFPDKEGSVTASRPGIIDSDSLASDGAAVGRDQTQDLSLGSSAQWGLN